MLWTFPLLLSSTTWGFCEVLADVSVDNGESEVPIPEGRKVTPQEKTAFARGFKLSGNQATLVSAITMLPVALVMHGMFHSDREALFNLHVPVTWLAMLAGLINACAHMMLYQAYESAPSTIIVPLSQLSAVFLVPLSTIVTALAPVVPLFASEEGAYLTPRELCAYAIIMVAGLYPATNGNFRMFLEKSFWTQRAVMFVLLQDVLLAFYNILIELCTAPHLHMSPEHFIIVSTYVQVSVYTLLFALVPRLREEARGLVLVLPRYLTLCAGAEAFNLVAYWMSTYAYVLHGTTNISVINACEVALNQVLNLFVAVGLKKCLRFGRDEAAVGLRTKMLSAGLITLGLLLVAHSSAPVPLAPGDTVPALSALDPALVYLPGLPGGNFPIDDPLHAHTLIEQSEYLAYIYQEMCSESRKRLMPLPSFKKLELRCTHILHRMQVLQTRAAALALNAQEPADTGRQSSVSDPAANKHLDDTLAPLN